MTLHLFNDHPFLFGDWVIGLILSIRAGEYNDMIIPFCIGNHSVLLNWSSSNVECRFVQSDVYMS